VKLESVDLNLLVSLRALIEERSVTRAAKRVGLSQPTVSGALARLRDMVGDELLVRTPQGMVLTARAEQLREPLGEILRKIEGTLSRAPAFDPATAELTFRVGTTDYLEQLVMPALSRSLLAAAPRVTIIARSVGPRRAGIGLEDAEIDLAIGHIQDQTAGLYRHVLFQERLVCIVRRDHPKVGASLDAATFASLPHLLVSPRSREKGPVDRLLEAEGLQRHVAYVSPHFLVAPMIVSQSDLVATLTERLAKSLAASFPIRILDLPFDVPPRDVVQVWHERTHRDPAHAWFRRMLSAAIA
jgi:DNA-binding transcriptional LysR family regulator